MCQPCYITTVNGVTNVTPGCNHNCLMKNGGIGQQDYIDVATIYQDECLTYFAGQQQAMTMCMTNAIVRNSENDPEAVDIGQESQDQNRRIIQIAALIIIILILIALILWL